MFLKTRLIRLPAASLAKGQDQEKSSHENKRLAKKQKILGANNSFQTVLWAHLSIHLLRMVKQLQPLKKLPSDFLSNHHYLWDRHHGEDKLSIWRAGGQNPHESSKNTSTPLHITALCFQQSKEDALHPVLHCPLVSCAHVGRK